MTVTNEARPVNGDRNMKLEQQDSSPCATLSRYKTFANRDQEQWWEYSAPLLGKILESSKYPMDQQYKYLSLYQNLMTPALGPYPHRWHASITYSGIPIEFSVNYQCNGLETVRIGFEPASYDSGTKRDSYNQITIRNTMSKIASVRPKGFNDKLFNQFMSDMTLSWDEAEQLGGAQMEGVFFKTQAALGLDFKDGEFVTKAYIYPALKCKAMNASLPELLNDLIEKTGDEMRCFSTVQSVNEYMEAGRCYNQYSFLGFDCVTPAKSRLKIYDALIGIAWAKAAEIWSLGGRVTTPDNIEGLKLFQNLWCLLTNGLNDRRVGIWNYELSPGKSEPTPKFYIDVHGESDYENAMGITKFFEQLGWTEKAAEFYERVCNFFPEQDLKNTTQLIQYVSFAYTEKSGPYVSVYYHSASTFPKIEG